MEPSSVAKRTTRLEHAEFLSTLAKDYGALEKQNWHNNNFTLNRRAYVIDCKNLKKDVPGILSRIFKYNMVSGRPPVLCIPVAGWDTSKDVCYLKGEKDVANDTFAENELKKEYAQSFSLSNMTTTGSQHVDFILRVAKEEQKIKVFEKEGKYFARISAGVRITDADTELFEKYGLAFFPNNTTLHTASVVGIFSNGCYGPSGKEGPISTKTVEMRVVDPFGNVMTLSNTQNQDLFRKVRDCHMSTCFFVIDITVEVQKKFLLKQHNVVYKDVEEFKIAAEKVNPLKEDHFVAMYFPSIENGLRITTMSRTEDKPSHVLTLNEHANNDYESLLVTNIGEPLIRLVVNSTTLRPYFPVILKAAALKTFGTEKETTLIDWSGPSYHFLRTYTGEPLEDLNWLIQVDSEDEACKMTIDLLALTKKVLDKEGEESHFPVLNTFVRYTKGVADPDAEGGIAPTSVNKNTQGILAFEFIAYTPLAKTASFKNAVDAVIEYLTTNKCQFTYHYPKHMPDDIKSLTQLRVDELSQKRLKNTQQAIFDFHGGEHNIQFSPFLTPEKKVFLGLASPDTPKPKSVHKIKKLTDEQKKARTAEKQRAITALHTLAIEQKQERYARRAKNKLATYK